MTAEQRQEINDLFVTDPVGAFDRYMEFRETLNERRGRLTDYHSRQIETVAPEFYRRYGDHIREGVSYTNKTAPGSEDAINVGIANAVLNAMRANKGDVVKTLREMAEALGEQTPARPAPAKPTAPATRPSQRVARPATSTEVRRPANTAPVRNGADSAVKALMAVTPGLTRAEAERAISAS
jgi:hypothetical protein